MLTCWPCYSDETKIITLHIPHILSVYDISNILLYYMATNYIFILLIPSSDITFGLVSCFSEQIPEK